MKKRIILSAVLGLSMVLSACGGSTSSTSSSAGATSVEAEAVENSGEKIVIKFAHEEAPGCAQDLYAHKFAELISEKTNGQVETQIYTIGQIGSDQDLVQILQTGGIQMSICTPSISSTIMPEAQIFDIHQIFSDDMEVNREVLKTSKALNETLTGLYADKGIKVGGYWTEGFMTMTANKPIETLEDMKGFKIRTMQSPLLVASYKAYGANPTPMPFSEVYSGLQLNTIEGHENPIFYINQNNMYEVQDYVIDSRHALYVTATLTNNAFYESLPDDIKVALDEAVAETNDYSFEMQAELNGKALDEMLSEKPELNVIEFSDEERAKFKEAAMPVREEYVTTVGGAAEEILNTLVEEVAAAEK